MKPNTVEETPEGGLQSATCSPSWKPGDWCFYHHKLAIVQEVEDDGRVTSVSDGFASTGYMDLRDKMFPLTIKGKRITDGFASEYDRLHRESRGVNLNFPDFHWWFGQKWAETMRAQNDDEVVCAAFKEMRDFVGGILGELTSFKSRDVMGVHILR